VEADAEVEESDDVDVVPIRWTDDAARLVVIGADRFPVSKLDDFRADMDAI
jgi:hypothetical protein